ncbi:DUF4625 domain-containing protein [Pontibacter ramchanderi]|uniref:Uncharacterized protein DUF4625 n=1 Tax=Pontibacter ramchanderi TaxID=1179743 RepID=A0A2N3V2W8_9BACT|nr:DUF4625 domain-containing protein [Pontibacter ramchanderi]PKV75964.1 uncharacterized protein DUF4625 [Pontibacter ramchanderi]
MRKIYQLSFILLLWIGVSCGGDDDPTPSTVNNPPDTEKPKIQLLTPEENSTFLVINLIRFNTRLSDNVALGTLKASLVSSDGSRSEIMEPFIFTDAMNITDFTGSFYPREIAPGTYTLLLEVLDRQKNMAKDSVAITIHAPAINQAEFENAFKKNTFYYYLDWGWFGFDFINGVEFVKSQFTYGLLMMMSMDNYINKDQWEKFVKDFQFEKQTWASWDKDGNGMLDDIEFHQGIEQLGLFEKWDQNKDKLVNEKEFVRGIFKSWDRNRDDVLSREEYFEPFYTYLSLH